MISSFKHNVTVLLIYLPDLISVLLDKLVNQIFFVVDNSTPNNCV